MPYLLGLLLALAAAALIAWPLLRARRAAAPPGPGALDALRETQRLRRQVYDEIRTLDLDRELGHVPNEQYEETLEAHRVRAAILLRQEERIRGELAQLMADVEDDVLALRLASGSVSSTVECAECGGRRDADAALCPRCETGNLDAQATEEAAE